MKKLSIFDTFLTVSKEQSLTKAAKILGISQAAVSKQMKTLEEYLGFVLFESSTSPKQLNGDGREFVRVVKSCKDSLEKFLDDRHPASATLNGRLSVCCIDQCSSIALKDIITDFGCMYPKVSINLKRSEIIDSFNYSSEGLFIILPDEDSVPGCTSITTFEPVPLGLAVPANIPLAQKSVIREPDLNLIRLIVSNSLYENTELGKWLSQKKPSVLYDDWDIAEGLFIKGGGMPIIPLNIQENYTTGLIKVIPLYPLVSVRLKLVYKSLREMTPTERTFANFIRNR